MKKFTAILCAVAFIFIMCSCSSDKTGNNNSAPGNTSGVLAPNGTISVRSDGSYENLMHKKTDAMEYTFYQNLFYEKNAADFKDKTFTKEGVFAILEDAYNNVTRYYVWGYADNTLCCDWQWEFVMPDGADIPESSSYVKMTGTCTEDSAALDGWWFTDVTLDVIHPYENAGYDYDLTTLSSTLVYVQVANFVARPDNFIGKSIRVFGRAVSSNGIQHPYYDNNWSLDFINGNKELATGEYLILTGKLTLNNDVCIVDATDVITAK